MKYIVKISKPKGKNSTKMSIPAQIAVAILNTISEAKNGTINDI